MQTRNPPRFPHVKNNNKNIFIIVFHIDFVYKVKFLIGVILATASTILASALPKLTEIC